MPQLAACLEGLQWDPLCHNKVGKTGQAFALATAVG